MGEIHQQCKILQDDELSVLESIYPGCVVEIPRADGSVQRLLTMNIAITLSSPVATHLIVTQEHTGLEPGGRTVNSADPDPLLHPAVSFSFNYLPGLNVALSLPPDYPLRSPPRSVRISAPLDGANADSAFEDARGEEWLDLNRTAIVQNKLEQVWLEENEMAGEGGTPGVLWRWWQWVCQGDFLYDLGLVYTDGSLHLPVPTTLSPGALHAALTSFNAKQQHASFDGTAFACAICFENRKGKRCHKMPGCDCVFCTTCLHACWSLAMTEGSIENVACPDPSCVKRRALREGPLPDGDDPLPQLDSELVESVVGKTLRERWEKLRDQRRVEIDPTFTFCPRPSCQAAVPPPKPTGDERWDGFRMCPRCNFSFCLNCLSTWHGAHTACPVSAMDLFLAEYLRMPAESLSRRHIENRLGLAAIKKLIDRYKEDQANKAWLASCTRPCPGCGVRVQKNYGCNHMSCSRCHTQFCWICGRKLDGYAHYNNGRSSCQWRLFDDLDEGAGEAVGEIAGLAEIAAP